MENVSAFIACSFRSVWGFAQLLTVLLPFALLFGGGAVDTVGSIIAVLFLYDSARQKNWQWLGERWVQCAFILWIYTLLRSMWVDDLITTLHAVVPWIRFPLLAAAIAYGVLRDENIARMLWRSMLAVVVFLIADGLLQYATGADVFGHPLHDLGGGVMRLTGPFRGPKLGIILVGLGFPVVLPLLNSAQRWAGALLAALFVFTIFASGERTALLLCLLGLGLAFLLWPGALRWRLGALALLVLVLVGGMAADKARMERQYHSTLEAVMHFSETPYGMLWQSGWNIAKENPWFGVGLRHFRDVCPQAQYGSADPGVLFNRCNLHPHNIYVEWLAETGIAGFALFMAMLACLSAQLMGGWKELRANPLYIGLCITLILRFWPLAATTSFFANWMAIPTWLMIGWALNMAKRALPA